MRTSVIACLSVLGVGLLAGCTVKDVDAPALSGPSTFARSITLTASPDTIAQNGLAQSEIRITATDPSGRPLNIPLRAEIYVGGVIQDFGTLSTKSPITNSTITYRAPAAPTTVGGHVSQLVTIAVTPVDSGDFRSEMARQVDIKLVPPGVILPTNPSLVPAFVFTPTPAQAFTALTFNAATTTNEGARCDNACTYSWTFGDGTSAAGMVTTHEYRTVGNFQVALSVTDNRGAQATTIQTVAVNPSTPPTAAFRFSPTPVGVNQDVFFTAEESRPATGRRITRYDWNFGDGDSSSGSTVTHKYRQNGTYAVVLTVTDDTGTTALANQTITVATGNPVATMTVLPSAPRAGQSVTFNASGSTSATSTIVSYKFQYGDGSEETVTSPVQSHIYTGGGTFVATVMVTDSVGRTGSFTVSVTVLP
jgi:PKD repeat protein